MVKTETLLKTVSAYLIYFVSTYLASFITKVIGLQDNQIVHLLIDVLFLIFIILFYQKNLKEDWQVIRKEYSAWKVIRLILFSFLLIVLANIVLAFIASTFFADVPLDQNTESIKAMATVSIIYTIFKTMIFGSIAEEILFRESLSDCIPNDFLFVLLSAIIYTAMNFVFTNTSFSIIQVLIYFVPALIYSLLYVKNKRNIILIMFGKFAYNLIPLTILIVGLFQ